MPNLTSMLSSDTVTSFSRYDLDVAATTTTLDLAIQQVFTVDATNSARTLSFTNTPTGRAMVVVIEVTGNNTITWPASINWSGGTAAELNAVWTEVTLLWNGTTWRGFKSGGAD